MSRVLGKSIWLLIWFQIPQIWLSICLSDMTSNQFSHVLWGFSIFTPKINLKSCKHGQKSQIGSSETTMTTLAYLLLVCLLMLGGLMIYVCESIISLSWSMIWLTLAFTVRMTCPLAKSLQESIVSRRQHSFCKAGQKGNVSINIDCYD